VAIRIQEILIDDLDGSTDSVTTRQFGLEDVCYEIDLSPANLQRLRAALAEFIAAGRRLPKTRRTKTGRARTGGARRRGIAAGRIAPPAPDRTVGAR
jgi:Lsr2